jgi:hypothetical protein
MVPNVSVVFPSTVLSPRDKRIAGEPLLPRPVPLPITVEPDTLTVATPVEELSDKTPRVALLEITHLATLT